MFFFNYLAYLYADSITASFFFNFIKIFQFSLLKCWIIPIGSITLDWMRYQVAGGQGKEYFLFKANTCRANKSRDANNQSACDPGRSKTETFEGQSRAGLIPTTKTWLFNTKKKHFKIYLFFKYFFLGSAWFQVCFFFKRPAMEAVMCDGGRRGVGGNHHPTNHHPVT